MRQLAAFLCTCGLALTAGTATLRAQGPGAPTEGIKVHGHWTIDLRNPDGALASHNEFENELYMSQGSGALAGILGRHLTVGEWVVTLAGGNGVAEQFGPCTTYCAIVEPSSAWATGDSKTFKNLTVGVPMSTTDGLGIETGTIELSGFVTATSATQIGLVRTLVGLCAANVLPSACGPNLGFGDYRFFTGKLLATPIVPSVGQIIQVKVVLSFS